MANLTLILTVTTMTTTRTEKFFDGAAAIAALNAANSHPLTKDVRLVNLVPTGQMVSVPGFGGLQPETREELVWEVLSDQPRWVTGAKAIPTEAEASALTRNQRGGPND